MSAAWLELLEEDTSTLPVSRERVKAHLRVDTNDEDDLIDAYILAAARKYETETSRGLFAARFAWRLDGWPANGAELPFGPVRHIESAGWLDAAGVFHALDDADWRLELSARGGRIVYRDGFTPPAPGRSIGGVVITFAAGHEPEGFEGTEAGGPLALPASAPVAIMLMVAHWYTNREAASPHQLAEIPLGAAQLMAAARIYR